MPGFGYGRFGGGGAAGCGPAFRRRRPTSAILGQGSLNIGVRMRGFGLTALAFAISLGSAAAQNLPAGPTPEQIQLLMQAAPKAGQLKPGEIDGDLVGTWQGNRTVPTAAFAEGTFTVRIFDKGQFISIFRCANAFQVETGRVLAAGGAMRWQVVPGRDDMMAYRIKGN